MPSVELVADGLVDAVEGRNAKTSLEHLQRAWPSRFAAEHDLAVGAGSDAHVPDALGAAYVEMADFATAGGVPGLAAIELGRRPPLRRAPPVAGPGRALDHRPLGPAMLALGTGSGVQAVWLRSP